MSAASVRMRLEVADRKARSLVALLEPFAERIAVAGSIRRCRADIGDIEICAVPKMVAAQMGLFGEPSTVGVNALNQRLDEMLEDGLIQKRRLSDGLFKWGPKYRAFTWDGAPIDLWQSEADIYGWLMAIRTGPASFSRQLVVPKTHKTRDGRPGLLPLHLRVRQGLRHSDGELVPTPTEQDVFAALGLRWQAPENRS